MNWYRLSSRLIVLSILSATLYFGLDYSWLQDRVASDAAFLLRNVFGLPFNQDGLLLSSATFTVEVSKDCTAIEALIIFVGALFLLTPLGLRRKAIIAVSSAAIIYSVNLFRIALELYLAVATTMSWYAIHTGTGLVLGVATVAGLVIAADKYSDRFRNASWMKPAADLV